MHGWKEHTSSSNLVCLSFWMYRVAELLPFELTSKRIQIRLKHDHKIVVFIAFLPKNKCSKGESCKYKS